MKYDEICTPFTFSLGLDIPNACRSPYAFMSIQRSLPILCVEVDSMPDLSDCVSAVPVQTDLGSPGRRRDWKHLKAFYFLQDETYQAKYKCP